MLSEIKVQASLISSNISMSSPIKELVSTLGIGAGLEENSESSIECSSIASATGSDSGIVAIRTDSIEASGSLKSVSGLILLHIGDISKAGVLLEFGVSLQKKECIGRVRG